jgi:hypothetical protein
MLSKYLTLVLLFTIASVTGCASAPHALDEQADCYAKSVSASEGYDLGEGARSLSTWEPSTWTKLFCSTGAAFNAEHTDKVVKAAILKIQASDAYRQGQFGAILRGYPPNINVAGFVQLAESLETAAAVRTAEITCHPEKEEAVSHLAELDYPFAMAVLGEKVGVPTEGMAKRLAVSIFGLITERAKVSAPQPCDASLTKKFEAHAASWLAFYEGKHPWAPNCHAEVRDEEVLLSCTPN